MVPETATVKVAFTPAETVWLAGCCVMIGCDSAPKPASSKVKVRCRAFMVVKVVGIDNSWNRTVYP